MRRSLRAFATLAAGVSLSATGAARDAIRLPLKVLQPIPVIAIEVSGKTIDVGVDTGGKGALQLTREVLAEVGAVELRGGSDTATNVYGESRHVRHFRLPEVRVGGRAFSDLIASESPDFKNAPNLPDVVGGLGQEFLHQFVVLVDYPGRVISLLPSDVTDSEAQAMGCYGSKAPLEHTDLTALAISRVKLDGAMVRLLWDTGAAYSTIPTSSATAHGLDVTSEKSGPPVYNSKRLLLGSSDFGPLQFVVLPVQLPTEFDGLLGYNLLVKHVVCIDYGRGEVQVR